MVRPWAEAGSICFCLDIQNVARVETFRTGGLIVYLNIDLFAPWCLAFVRDWLRPDIIFGFPPCTDLATSGAKHFARKLRDDPLCQIRAVWLAMQVERIANACGVPWMAENPRSVLSTMWRKRDHVFDPSDFGGYLPTDDVHPRWPEFIAPRDAYPKETWIWSGNGFKFPKKLPVDVRPGYSDQFLKLGGKSKKTKMIRSETPRGFAKAVWLHNF